MSMSGSKIRALKALLRHSTFLILRGVVVVQAGCPHYAQAGSLCYGTAQGHAWGDHKLTG
jgi:hypothetical protein